MSGMTAPVGFYNSMSTNMSDVSSQVLLISYRRIYFSMREFKKSSSLFCTGGI